MNTPLISVIIPVYNAAPYLERCILSVFRQTFNSWEIVAVNDGSSDGSLEILHEMASRDTRVKYYNKQNEGVVIARDYALAHSNGEYLFFLDSDDYLPPDSLQIMYNAMLNAQADLCIGSYTLVWDKTQRKTFINHKKTFSSSISCMKYCLKYGEMFMPIKLYKASIFKKTVNIPHDIIIQEDTIALTQYLEYEVKVTYVSKNVYFYFKHTDSTTSKITIRHIYSLLKVAEFLLNCNIYNKLSWTIQLNCAKIIKTCTRSGLVDSELHVKIHNLSKQLSWCAKTVVALDTCKNKAIAQIKKLL